LRTTTIVYDFGLEPPTLMKIDVEGWELEVLLGAQKLMHQMPPKAIAFETTANERGEPLNTALLEVRRANGESSSRENYLALRKAD